MFFRLQSQSSLLLFFSVTHAHTAHPSESSTLEPLEGGDKVPLIDDGVDGGVGLVLVGGDGLGGVTIGGNLVGAVSNLGVDGGNVDLVGLVGDLALNEGLPGVVGALDDLEGVGLVLGLAVEGELVLGLAVGNLVDAEPLLGGLEESGHLLLDVLNVVELRGEGVGDINGDDLPVGLTLVKEGQAAQDLDLLDLAGVGHRVSNLADVKGIIVPVGVGVSILVVRVLPGLGEGTVVPDVPVVREAVVHEAQLPLLHILLNRVKRHRLGDLFLQ